MKRKPCPEMYDHVMLMSLNLILRQCNENLLIDFMQQKYLRCMIYLDLKVKFDILTFLKSQDWFIEGKIPSIINLWSLFKIDKNERYVSSRIFMFHALQEYLV
jgi:hypothetical protein